MSEFSDELKHIMAGEFSTAFIVKKNGVQVYDSADFSLGCIFDKTFLMVGEDGAQVQSNYSRAQIPIESIETETADTITDDFTFTIEGAEYPVRHAERYGHGLGIVEFRAPL